MSKKSLGAIIGVLLLVIIVGVGLYVFTNRTSLTNEFKINAGLNELQTKQTQLDTLDDMGTMHLDSSTLKFIYNNVNADKKEFLFVIGDVYVMTVCYISTKTVYGPLVFNYLEDGNIRIIAGSADAKFDSTLFDLYKTIPVNNDVVKSITPLVYMGATTFYLIDKINQSEIKTMIDISDVYFGLDKDNNPVKFEHLYVDVYAS